MSDLEVSISEESVEYEVAPGLPLKTSQEPILIYPTIVREKSRTPTKLVLPGSLLVFINGLLSETVSEALEADEVVLVYFTTPTLDNY